MMNVDMSAKTPTRQQKSAQQRIKRRENSIFLNAYYGDIEMTAEEVERGHRLELARIKKNKKQRERNRLLDRALAGKVSADDVVFVFARALKGPPMPLAVVRRRAAELPLTVELGDAQSLLPDRLLSSVDEIAVGARISRQGTADAQAGDLEAVLVPVRQGSGRAQIELRISNVRP